MGEATHKTQFIVDHDLCCNEEEYWVDDDERVVLELVRPSPFPHQYYLLDEQEELQTLLSYEERSHFKLSATYLQLLQSDLMTACQEAIDWILSVKSYYAFSALTAFLSVTYLHRFLDSFQFPRNRNSPNWMLQLAAVACLSLAAKVEETQVPPLFHLQVVKSKFKFEPKSIQRMELLVLSTLDWKMNPVTPFSFLHHIITRPPLAFLNCGHTNFVALFELILLSLISSTDPRFLHYRPSIVAAAISLHVLNVAQIEYYKTELCKTLKLSKDELAGRMSSIDP